MNQVEMSRAKRLWVLFRSCFVISTCTFGGGMVVISMLQKKFVDELHWIDQDEVMDMCAIAQSCPGVMAVNTSIILGYRIGGVAGGILTALGTILPPMIILSVISLFYAQFRSNAIVAMVLRGMQAGVVAVMINMTVKMFQRVLEKRDALTAAMLILACAAALHPSIDIVAVLLACGLIGGLRTLLWEKRRRP